MIDALRWWLAIEAVAIVALPLCLALFRPLPDRGFAFNKAFALLALGYVFWLLNSFHVLPNSTAGVLVALATVAAGSAAVLAFHRRDIAAWLRGAWAYIIAVEVLTAAVFALVAWFQAYSGQIILDETVMEFMLLNAVHQADHFPPQDAWLSGHDVAYYYFGYVIVSALARISALRTEIAFNTGFATFAAMAVSAALGLAFNLLQLRNSALVENARMRLPRIAVSSPSFAGAVGSAALLILLGNLVASLLFASAYGIGGDGFYGWLNISGLSADEPRHWWYPNQAGTFASAGLVIKVHDNFGFVESPFQSIITADLHPQYIDLPFVLLGLACALTLLLLNQRERNGGAVSLDRAPEVEHAPYRRVMGAGQQFPLLVRSAAFGLLIGATGFTNTWDLPVVLAVATLCLVLRAWFDTDWSSAAASATILVLVALVAYLPFYLQLDRASTGLYAVVANDVVSRPGSQPVHFLLHWLPLFVLVAPFAATRVIEQQSRLRSWHVAVAVGAPAMAIAAWAVLFLIQDAAGAEHLQHADGLFGQIATRGSSWVSAFVAAAIVAAAIAGLLASEHRLPRHRAEAFVLLLIGSGAAIILFAEFFYADDYSQSRLVALFKLTYVAWAFLAVAAGYAGYDLITRLRAAPSPAVALWASSAAVVVAAGLLLPLGAIPNRISDDQPSDAPLRFPRTLDGLAIYDSSDRAAIGWLRDRAKGQGLVLAESVDDPTGASDYRYTGRFSMASGLPAVLAWPGHEEQWRGSTEDLGTRQEDIDFLYRSPGLADVQPVVEHYGIDLIIVGSVERAVYPAASLEKFAQYPVAFQQGDVTIYAVDTP